MTASPAAPSGGRRRDAPAPRVRDRAAASTTSATRATRARGSAATARDPRAVLAHPPVVLRDRARRTGQDRAVHARGARRSCRRSSAVGIAALATQSGEVGEVVEAASPIRYDDVPRPRSSTLVMLFCAAQAPGAVRPRPALRRPAALLLARARPARLRARQGRRAGRRRCCRGARRRTLVLFVGRVLVAPDPVDGPRRRAAEPPAAPRPGAPDGGLLGGARDGRSRPSRRAGRTRPSAIIAVFLIPPIVVGARRSATLSGERRRLARRCSARSTSSTGRTRSLFGVRPGQPRSSRRRPARRIAFVAAALVGIAVLDRADDPALPADRGMTDRRRRPRRCRSAPGVGRAPDRRRPAAGPRPSTTSRAGTATSSRSTTSRSRSGPGVTGLLGPNGAGKSTLLHLIAGLLAAVGRAASWSAASRPGGNPAMYRHVGLVPEREAVHGFLTGREFVAAQRPAPGAAGRRRGRRPGDRDGRPRRTPRTARSAPTRRGCASGSSSPAPSSTTRRSCCSTSRSTGWTRASGCT